MHRCRFLPTRQARSRSEHTSLSVPSLYFQWFILLALRRREETLCGAANAMRRLNFCPRKMHPLVFMGQGRFDGPRLSSSGICYAISFPVQKEFPACLEFKRTNARTPFPRPALRVRHARRHSVAPQTLCGDSIFVLARCTPLVFMGQGRFDGPRLSSSGIFRWHPPPPCPFTASPHMSQHATYTRSTSS